MGREVSGAEEPKSFGPRVLPTDEHSGQLEPWRLAGLFPLFEKEDEES